MELRTIARALGGEIIGERVVAPGPGHSPNDRSLWVRLSAHAPDGVLCGSFAGDNWQSCKDHLRQRLGLPIFSGMEKTSRRRRDIWQKTATPDRSERNAAVRIWHEARDPCGTLVQHYLESRGLNLPDDANNVIDFHPACTWREGETITRVPAMVTALRSTTQMNS